MILLFAVALAQTVGTPGAAAPSAGQTAPETPRGTGIADGSGAAVLDDNPYFPAAAMRPPDKHGPIAEFAERLRLQPDLCSGGSGSGGASVHAFATDEYPERAGDNDA